MHLNPPSVTSVRCFPSARSRPEAAVSTSEVLTEVLTSEVLLCPTHVGSGPRVHPNDFSLLDKERNLDGFAGFEFRGFLHVIRAIPPDSLGRFDDFQQDR